MYGTFQSHLRQQLLDIDAAGLTKRERIILSPQDAHISVQSGAQVLNMCANNYLGLAENPQVKAAAAQGLDQWGYGLRAFDSSAAHKLFTRNWSRRLAISLAPKTPSCIRRALMRTVGCSKRCWARKMRSFPMN